MKVPSPFPAAWIDGDGSPAAFVIDEEFSAMRAADGAWSVPSPSISIGALESAGFKLASAEEAAALAKAARMSASVSPVRAK